MQVIVLGVESIFDATPPIPVAAAETVYIQLPEVPCVIVHVLDCVAPSVIPLIVFGFVWLPILHPPELTVNVKLTSTFPPAVTLASLSMLPPIAALETELLTITTTFITFTFLFWSTTYVSVTESSIILENPLFPDFVALNPEKVTSVDCPGLTDVPED